MARKTNRDEIRKLIIPTNAIVSYSYDTNWKHLRASGKYFMQMVRLINVLNVCYQLFMTRRGYSVTDITCSTRGWFVKT